MRQRPGAVIVDVADETKFAAGLQHARHRGDRRVLHEAPLPVPPLRPGIGMDQVDPRQRAGGSQASSSAASPANRRMLPMLCGLDLREDLCHAVDIGLAADEAGVAESSAPPPTRCSPPPKPISSRTSSAARIEDLGKIAPALAVDVERKMRQQMIDQIGLVLRGACGPCGGRRTSLALRVIARDRGSGLRLRVIAASDTADAAAAPAARSRRCTSARNGCVRPCRRRRGRRASRCAAR